MLIGITGGSGCGKSVATREFEKIGAEIIDADKTAREITAPGSPIIFRIADELGKEYIDSDNSLKRKKLGAYVFSNPEALNKLNLIMKEYISDAIQKKLSASKSDLVVLDAPLLIEYGMEKNCDKVISVLADEDIRIERICKRDKISPENAKNRIKSQKNNQFYIEKSDFIVYNNSTEEIFADEIKKIISALF